MLPNLRVCVWIQIHRRFIAIVTTRPFTCESQTPVAQEESHSTPALLTTGGPNVGNSAVSLGIIPEHSLLESCARLSVSLEGPGIFNVQKSSCSSSSHSSSSTTTRSGSQHHMTLDELRAVNRYAESTKSLSYLPQVRVMY